MSITVPTWMIVLPAIGFYVWGWVYWASKVWDRWVTPWIMRRFIRHEALRTGWSEDEIRALLHERHPEIRL